MVELEVRCSIVWKWHGNHFDKLVIFDITIRLNVCRAQQLVTFSLSQLNKV